MSDTEPAHGLVDKARDALTSLVQTKPNDTRGGNRTGSDRELRPFRSSEGCAPIRHVLESRQPIVRGVLGEEHGKLLAVQTDLVEVHRQPQKLGS